LETFCSSWKNNDEAVKLSEIYLKKNNKIYVKSKFYRFFRKTCFKNKWNKKTKIIKKRMKKQPNISLN